jgi:branched-chain amino acid transport system permease protein
MSDLADIAPSGSFAQAGSRPSIRPRGLSLVARVAPWILAAAILVVAPLVFTSGTALTMMSLMGIMVVFSLSYNMLLGQTGLLSFGHAVYYGLGAFFTVHAMNLVASLRLPVPLPLMPVVGSPASPSGSCSGRSRRGAPAPSSP